MAPRSPRIFFILVLVVMVGTLSFPPAAAARVDQGTPIFSAEPLTVNEITLEQTTSLDEPIAWTSISGSLADGYDLPLDTSVVFYYLNVDEITTSAAITNDDYGFYITAYPGGFFDYWDSRGVNEYAQAGDWQFLMWQIINGDLPIFYLDVEDGGSNKTYTLLDGMQYAQDPATAGYLRINGDYLPGAYSFQGTLTTSEGDETITTNITFNDIPVLSVPAGPFEVEEEVQLAFTTSAIDLYPIDGDFSYSLSNAPETASITPVPDTRNAQFSWTPAVGSGGSTYTFSVQVCDAYTIPACDDEEIDVVVNVPNWPPYIDPQIEDRSTNELSELTINITANDGNSGNQALTFSLISDQNGAELYNSGNQSATFAWTPTEDQGDGSGYSFTVQVCEVDDSTKCGQDTFEVQVNEVNQAPVLDSIGDKTVNEDEPLTFTATANDGDIPTQTLTYSLTAFPEGASIDSSAGIFTWTPVENQSPGTFDVTIQVCDDFTTAACDSETIAVTVNEVPDAPVADPQEVTLDEDTPKPITLTGSDPDEGSSLSFAVLTDPINGSLSGTAPDLTYTPNPNYHGTDSFTFQVTDDTQRTDTATVSITVTSVNDAPVAEADFYGTDEDYELIIDVGDGLLYNDSDIEGDALSAVVDVEPGHGTLDLDPNGSFTYTPELNYNGQDTFTYKACDYALCSQAVTVTIYISAVNDPPTAIADTFTAYRNVSLQVSAPGVLENDEDLEDDPMKAQLVSGPAHGSLTLNPDGSFLYLPDRDHMGQDSFEYQACDLDIPICGDSAVVTITIQEITIYLPMITK